MKRTLAIALATLAVAATSAQATTQAPQPSFADYPLSEANVPARTDAGRNAGSALPQPSFVDYVAVEADGRPASSSRLVVAEFPQPSFAN
jgi:hypothetical protein